MVTCSPLRTPFLPSRPAAGHRFRGVVQDARMATSGSVRARESRSPQLAERPGGHDLGDPWTAASVSGWRLSTDPLQRGFILGSGVTLVFGMVGVFVVLLSGTAPLMMGELAEQWTAQELRPLAKHGWRLVNHFGLSYGDQDHVLVGPGGVVLLETKWSATPWNLDDRGHFFQMAVGQTTRNAGQLQKWAGVARHGRPVVEPVLVLWGQAGKRAADTPVRRHATGVLVVPGKQLQDWALRRGRDQLTQQQVEAIWTEIARQVDKRDAAERQKHPMPRSLQELVLGALVCVAAALVGFVLGGQVLERTGSLWVWVAAGFVMIGVAELVRRRSRWRWLQAGTLLLYVLGAAVVARAYLQAS
jgi:hypothetical protein